MVKYGYNAFGKPVVKYRRDPTEGWYVDSYFLWDGDELVADFDSAGHRRADYMYYPGIDQPFAENLGATSVTATRYHQQDATGNVTGTVDGTSLSQTVTYDAWGTPTVTGNWDNRLLWKGLMWEGDAVSLYYVRNRWYDPELGRFISEDPAGFSGGDNLYAFAGDDPINGSDPSGMCPNGYANTGVKTSIGTTWCLPPIVVYADPLGHDRTEQCDVGRETGSNCPWFQTLEQRQDPWTDERNGDPCNVYQGNAPLGSICKRVSSPIAAKVRRCTAQCLANKWDQLEHRLGREPKPGEALDYLFFQHTYCYEACRYSKAGFLSDYLTGIGSHERDFLHALIPDLGIRYVR
jgi:RHS repeat-associated protein